MFNQGLNIDNNGFLNLHFYWFNLLNKRFSKENYKGKHAGFVC